MRVKEEGRRLRVASRQKRKCIYIYNVPDTRPQTPKQSQFTFHISRCLDVFIAFFLFFLIAIAVSRKAVGIWNLHFSLFTFHCSFLSSDVGSDPGFRISSLLDLLEKEEVTKLAVVLCLILILLFFFFSCFACTTNILNLQLIAELMPNSKFR